MVEAEKPQNNLTDSENPTHHEEGGDAKQSRPETELDQDQKKPTQQPTPFQDEENEYSDEEYQRYVDLYDRTLTDIKQGQIVQGRVLAIGEQYVLVDIGFKSEGTIDIEEFGDPPEVKIGDKIEVYLEAIEDADGQLILSKKKAAFMRLWDHVVDIYNEGGTIDGKCVRRIKGGIVVDLMGVDAFLPGSQIDVKPIRDFDALIGQTFTFRIVKVNKLRKNIVVSRRALLEESMKEQRVKILDELEKGRVYEGMVKNITDFGVFVDLGGVDGLLHINDLSWGRIRHPSEVVKLDATIKVVVLDFNDAKDRISLGYKQLQPHPWDNIETKYPEGSVVEGKVVSITDYGAFVELERGVEGLVHVSEMSWTRHGIHPSKVVSVGEKINVKILDVDKDKKRISLGLKQLTADPWDNIEERYPVGSKITGRVRNMTNFGAFVEIEDGIDGLIHISDLSWTRKIKHPSEILKKSEEVEVAILDVNRKDRRISLGYKQLTDDPWPAFEEAYKVDTVTTAKVVRFVDKGMVVELPLGLEGFVPLSQLPESSIGKVSQTLKVDDDIDLCVIEFDRDNKRIVLSRKKIVGSDEKQKGEAEKDDVKSYMENQEGAPTLEEMAGLKDEEAQTEEPKEKKKKKKSKADKELKAEAPSEPETPVEEEIKAGMEASSESETPVEKKPKTKTDAKKQKSKKSNVQSEDSADAEPAAAFEDLAEPEPEADDSPQSEESNKS